MDEYGTAPVLCLSAATLAVLERLDEPRLLPAAGLRRDWRGLSQLTGVRTAPGAGPVGATRRLLRAWARASPTTASVATLVTYLERLDRWDVLHDCQSCMEADAIEYLNSNNQNTVETIVKNDNDNSSSVYTEDADALTFSDMQTLSLQKYDAFVLFADEDIDFAKELINKLNEYGFKICIRDDLLCGVSSEHSAVIKLITERCTRLIVILTPEFIKSQINTFIIDYTQALGIERNQRKILPIIYKTCSVPPQLSYCFLLNYNRLEKSHFWHRLRDSLEVKSPVSTSSQGTQELYVSQQKAKLHSKPVNGSQLSTIAVPNHPTQSTSMNDLSNNKDVSNVSLPNIDFSNSMYDIPSNVEVKPVRKNKVRKKIQKFLNRFAH